MLAREWNERKKKYDFVVIGSGYGGAILAARISGADLNPKKTVCLLERGKEWPIGKFPDTLSEVSAAARHPLINPLGLYEYLTFSDIDVIKGSGLGGTSLINANVAIVPDEEVLNQPAWPRNLKLENLKPYYEKAAKMLAARPHPRANDLLKVKALDRRAQQIGNKAFGLNITVNFDIDGENPYGVEQKPCIDCGDCVTGCNVSAKNTLYMNYLPFAWRNGCDIFTQTRVDWLEKLAGGRLENSRPAVHSVWTSGEVYPGCGLRDSIRRIIGHLGNLTPLRASWPIDSSQGREQASPGMVTFSGWPTTPITRQTSSGSATIQIASGGRMPLDPPSWAQSAIIPESPLINGSRSKIFPFPKPMSVLPWSLSVRLAGKTRMRAMKKRS